MAAPAFVQAGSGLTVTTGTATASLAGATAGNLIIVQGYADGTTLDFSVGNAVNTNTLAGTGPDLSYLANFGTGSTVVGYQFIELGRVISNGTVSQDFTVGGSGEDLFGRIYEFSGASTGSTFQTVIESDPDPYAFTKGTSTTVSSQAVVTTGTDGLGCQFVAINANQATVSFTGETGTDWTETVAEYNGGGSLATLQLQTGAIATATTAGGGGSMTITSAEWCTIGFRIIPAISASGTPTPRTGASSLRW